MDRNNLKAALLVLSMCASATGQDKTTSEPALPKSNATASIETIREWVKQLDSKDFTQRATATKNLSAADAKAAPLVAEAAREGSIEVGLRAVQILDSLYQSKSDSTVDSAEAGLVELRSAKHAGVARRALDSLKRHYPIRQERAVTELRKLGCQIQFNRLFGRRAPGFGEDGSVSAVAIGPDWTGGEKGLDQVARLDSLRTVYFLNGHGLKEELITELQKRLPQMTVQRRGAAFLGVGTENDPLGCLIGQVKVNSAASKGGLRDFDVVIEFGGKPVLGANDLIEAIASYGPDEKVKVVVLRDYDRGFQMKQLLVEMIHEEDQFRPLVALALMSNMKVELEITLGKWDLSN